MSYAYVKFSGISKQGTHYTNVIRTPAHCASDVIQRGFDAWKTRLWAADIKLMNASWARITRPPLRVLRQDMATLSARYADLDQQRRDLVCFITPTPLSDYL